MCAVRWHVIPIPRPTGVKCLVACLYSHLRRRRAFILIAQPVAQFFRKGFGYAALQEHTASFSANRATHVTSVILRNPRTPLFSGASAPHTHTLTHSRTRTLYTDNQHFAIWSTSLKAGIFSVVLTEGLNCREVCNGNLCCVIAWEEKIAKQRLFSPSLYTSLCLLFFFFMQEKEYLYHSFWRLCSLNSLSLVLSSFFPPLLISYVCAVCGVSRRRWTLFLSYVYFFLAVFENEREHACVAKFFQVQIYYAYIYMLWCCVSAFRCVLLSTFRDFYTCRCILYSYRGNAAEPLAHC